VNERLARSLVLGPELLIVLLAIIASISGLLTTSLRLAIKQEPSWRVQPLNRTERKRIWKRCTGESLFALSGWRSEIAAMNNEVANLLPIIRRSAVHRPEGILGVFTVGPAPLSCRRTRVEELVPHRLSRCVC
jgi:hypothetical protein